LAEKKSKRAQFTSVSMPKALMDEIERVVKELRYWPTKTAFVHHACLEELERYKKELEERKREEAEGKKTA
jgi:metal-responsive CopG/Arc/MetJ family transcriptional regulator